MPGPLSKSQQIAYGFRQPFYLNGQYIGPHRGCRNGALCTGPGCLIITGKTNLSRGSRTGVRKGE